MREVISAVSECKPVQKERTSLLPAVKKNCKNAQAKSARQWGLHQSQDDVESHDVVQEAQSEAALKGDDNDERAPEHQRGQERASKREIDGGNELRRARNERGDQRCFWLSANQSKRKNQSAVC